MKVVLIILVLMIGIDQTAEGQANSDPPEGINLSEAIDRALQNATHVRIAEADKEASDAASGLLSSGHIPNVYSSLSYTKSQYPQIVTPIRQQGAFPPLDDQLYEASIQAEWNVFDFGQSRAVRKKALALAEAANIKYELAEMETIESTASAFIQLQQLKELKKVQEARIEALNQSKKQLEALYEEGRVAKIDLLKIEDTILEAETEIVGTENNIDQILQALTDDLNLQEPLEIDAISSIVFESDVIFDPEGVPVESSPPVSAARQQWRASDLERKASYRAFLPKINLFAAEQIRSGSDFEIDDQWMVGVRMNFPLFAGKSVVNNQVKSKQAKSKKIALEQARQQYRQQLNRLTNAQFETQKSIQSAEARVDFLEETYRVETSSNREGRTTLTDLLTTESKLHGVRAELIAMRAQLRLLNLNIAVLTGQLNKNLAIKLAEGEQL